MKLQRNNNPDLTTIKHNTRNHKNNVNISQSLSDHYAYKFFTAFDLTGRDNSSPFIFVRTSVPPENAFFTTYGPS